MKKSPFDSYLNQDRSHSDLRISTDQKPKTLGQKIPTLTSKKHHKTLKAEIGEVTLQAEPRKPSKSKKQKYQTVDA